MSTPCDLKGAHRLPGFIWMPGMMTNKGRVISSITGLGDGHLTMLVFGYETDSYVMREVSKTDEDLWPNPIDPTTEGCLLRLLGGDAEFLRFDSVAQGWSLAWEAPGEREGYRSLGMACIEVAYSSARWSGGVP